MAETNGLQLLQSFSDAVSELVEKVSPSVVSINAGGRSGTGLVWSREGHIVTANHIIGRSPSAMVGLGDGRELLARVVGNDPYNDVALLKVEEEGLHPIGRGGSEGIRIGQFVLALANMNGRKPSATSGIITSLRRPMRGFWGVIVEDAVVSDAKLNPGYSGGPLVDAAGQLLGMNVAYFAGRGVAVSAASLAITVEKISKDGRVKKGFLGVVVEPIEVPEDLAKAAEVGQETGLLVRSVEPGSPARAAGLLMGDVILSLGSVAASDEYRLHKALREDAVGKQLTLKILRAEKVVHLTVTPKEVE